MGSVLAIVSKAIFEKQAPSGLAVGGTWSVDRYLSKNPGLRALGATDALFLVTVRPGERLWLVGVLEAPTFDGEQWVAAPNRVAVVDITDALPRLKLASGKGVTAEPGKLGMSLQTPRELAAGDVVLLRGVAGPELAHESSDEPSAAPKTMGVEEAPAQPPTGKRASKRAKAPAAPATKPTHAQRAATQPAASAKKRSRPSPSAPTTRAPSRADPAPAATDDAPTLAEVIAELRAHVESLPVPVRQELATALTSVARSPAKAAGAVKAMVKKLGEGEIAIALWDAMAAAILEQAKSKGPAADCHAAARAIERKLGRKPELERAVRHARALALEGAIWTKEIILLAKAVKAARRADLATTLTLAAADVVCHGEPATANLVKALIGLGPEHAHRALRTWIVRASRQLTKADDDLWSASAEVLADLVDQDETVLAWMVAHEPTARRAPGWLEALATARVAERVASERPELARELALRYLSLAARIAPERALGPLETTLTALVPALAARGDTIPVVSPLDRYEPLHLRPPHVVDLLLALGAPLDFADAEHASFHLYEWSHLPRECRWARLEHLAHHPLLAARLRESVLDHVEHSEVSEMAVRLAESAVPGALDAAAALIEGIAETGSLGSYHFHQNFLTRLCEPAVIEACPRIAEAVLALDPVRMLHSQLRHGLLAEWGWPALDAVAARLPPRQTAFTGIFPHLTYHVEDQLVVVGPEGVVLEHRADYIASDFAWIRQAVYVDGDVFIVSGSYQGRWVRGGQTVARTDVPPLVDPLTGDGLLKANGTWFRRGDLDPSCPEHSWGPWYDGESLYLKHGEAPYRRFEPNTGKELAPGLPTWVARVLPPHASPDGFCLRVPERAEESPLGARDGVGGYCSSDGPRNERLAYGIDGRKLESPLRAVGWYALEALITFPERPGIHPVERGHGGHWVFLPDLQTPLLCVEDSGLEEVAWAGAPLRLGIHWWHLFRPRDPTGSRALADTSLERARALFDAARSSTVAKPEPAEQISYPGLTVTMTRPSAQSADLEAWPEVRAAAGDIFPEITHPRLLAGVVRMAVFAQQTGDAIRELGERVKLARMATHQAALTNRDIRELDAFFHADFERPGRWGQDRLGQQMLDVASFLFEPSSPSSHRRVVVPAACFVTWERLLVHGRELLHSLLAPATPPALREQIKNLLLFYRETPFATRASELRLVGLELADVPFTGLDPDHRDRLVEWETRCFLRCLRFGGGGRPFEFAALVATLEGEVRAPVGARQLWEEPLVAPLDVASIDQALALLAQRGPAKLWEESVFRLAEMTGMMRNTAALLLGGCHFHLPDKGGLKLLDIPQKHLELAASELHALAALHTMVATAVPQNLDELYRPLERGADGESFVTRLAARWLDGVGKRTPLPVEVFDRMVADIRDPYPPFHEAARALVEPDRIPMATTDAVWVVRPFATFTPNALHFGSVPFGWPQHHDEPPATFARRWPDPNRFGYEALGRMTKYLAWAYLELPVGDPLRAGAARLGSHFRARLASEQHLLPIAMGAITDAEALSAFRAELGGAAYAAGDGGASAAGVERDGLVLCWPDGDRAHEGVLVMLRTREVSALDAPAFAHLGLGPAGLFDAPTLPGVSLEALPYLPMARLWTSLGWRALLHDLGSPTASEGSFVANPLVSAPEAVATVASKHDISSEAAALYLMVRWLGEPTPARVLRYTGWSKATFAAASDALLARELLLKTIHKGTDRALFVPGPVAYFERYPAPVEASKLAALGLVEGKRPLLSVPLPISPVPELYRRVEQAAAQLD